MKAYVRKKYLYEYLKLKNKRKIFCVETSVEARLKGVAKTLATWSAERGRVATSTHRI